jgi:hypothetical protein
MREGAAMTDDGSMQVSRLVERDGSIVAWLNVSMKPDYIVDEGRTYIYVGTEDGVRVYREET